MRGFHFSLSSSTLEAASANSPGTAQSPAANDPWLTPTRFSLLLGGLILVSFSKIWFGEETFFYRDFANYGYPNAFYFRESFWQGRIPLWDPWNNCGIPFLAQWNTQTLYPFSIFYLLFPLSWSLGVYCLLHIFWAGLGMYFLADHWTGNRLGASVAGLTFAFNGVICQSIEWPHYVCSLAWMPWTVLAVTSAWRRGGSCIVGAALAGAVQVLSGTPEITIFTWIILATFWLFELLKGAVPRRGMFGRFMCIIVLIAALSAVQLLPFFELLACSHRDTGFGTSEWSMPLSGWMNYLAPLLFASPGPHGAFLLHGQTYFRSYYVGAGTLALALVAAWKVRKAEVWVLIILAVGGLILAMGDQVFLYRLRWLIPPIGFMRYPVKFVMLVNFVIPLLAAYAVSWFRAVSGKESENEQKTFLPVGMILFVVTGIIAWQASHNSSRPNDASMVLQNVSVRILFASLTLGGLWIMRHLTKRRARAFAGICFLALFWADLFSHAPALNPTITREAYQAGLAPDRLSQVAALQNGESRVMVDAGTVATVFYRWPESPLDDVKVRRSTLFSNLNLLDHIPKTQGFFPLYLREMNEIARLTIQGTNSPSSLLDFMAVSHVSDPEKPGSWTPRSTAMSMVSIGQEALYAAGSNTLRGMAASDFDPRRFVYLPLEAKPHLASVHSSRAQIRSCKVAIQDVDLEVESDGPAIVTAAQAFYPCWRAYVDGERVTLWRGNHAFQALEVPAGRHHVQLIYRDVFFVAGAVTSLLALAACFFLWVVSNSPGVIAKWRARRDSNAGNN